MSDRYTTLIDGAKTGADTSTPRIVIAVDGLDKNGKDHFAATAPKPTLLLDFDMGSEGVKGWNHPLVVRPKPFSFRPTEISFNMEDDQVAARLKAMKDAAWPQYNRFRDTYLRALEKPILKRKDGRTMMAKTIVVNTASEQWELLRYVELGQMTKVMPHQYTEVNAHQRDLVRSALEAGVNVIWLHQLKAEWKDKDGKQSKTGVLERAGNERMANLVQGNFLVYRVPNVPADQVKPMQWKWGEQGMTYQPTPRENAGDLGFRLVCGNNRHDPGMEGLELQNDMIDFRTIASMMMPETNDGDWADDA